MLGINIPVPEELEGPFLPRNRVLRDPFSRVMETQMNYAGPGISLQQQTELIGPATDISGPQPQQDGGLLGAIGGFFQQNPELAGGLLGGLVEGISGRDFGAGAEAGFMGASNIIESMQRKEALRQKGIDLRLKEQREIQKQKMQQENTLRDDFAASKKRFNDAKTSIQKLENTLTAGTAAGDLAAIFSFMKILDPGSTVREGEKATVENSRGIPDTLRAQYNKALTGQGLAADQRIDLLRRSRDLYNAEKSTFIGEQTSFANISARQGLNIKNVIGESKSVDLQTLDDLIKSNPQAFNDKQEVKDKKYSGSNYKGYNLPF